MDPTDPYSDPQHSFLTSDIACVKTLCQTTLRKIFNKATVLEFNCRLLQRRLSIVAFHNMQVIEFVGKTLLGMLLRDGEKDNLMTLLKESLPIPQRYRIS